METSQRHRATERVAGAFCIDPDRKGPKIVKESIGLFVGQPAVGGPPSGERLRFPWASEPPPTPPLQPSNAQEDRLSMVCFVVETPCQTNRRIGHERHQCR